MTKKRLAELIDNVNDRLDTLHNRLVETRIIRRRPYEQDPISLETLENKIDQLYTHLGLGYKIIPASPETAEIVKWRKSDIRRQKRR